MKTRLTGLFAGALLLAVAAASGTTAAGTTPSADAFIASLGCSGASATDVAMSAVPSAPAVEGAPARANLVMTCGTCSSNPCKGAVYDTSCVIGTRRGSCISPLGNNCIDGTWQCQCWSGPLP